MQDSSHYTCIHCLTVLHIMVYVITVMQDDTHIYMECDNDAISIQNMITCIQNWVADICTWMMKNSLKIKEDKTEFIFCSNRLNQTENDFSFTN